MSWHLVTSHPLTAPLIAALICALVLACALANWPIAAAGPMTAAERSNAKSVRWRRFRGAAGLALALATLLAVVLAMAVPEKDSGLVLISRARKTPVPWSELKDAKLRSTRAWFDLGPVIDDLQPAFDESSWSRASSAERRRARSLLGSVASAQAPEVDEPGAARHGRSQLPTWLVESIEISEVLVAVRTRNIKTVVVAPGVSSTPSGWRILKQVLVQQSVNVVILGEPLPVRAEALTVSSLSLARSWPDDSVSFWALIDGKATGSKEQRSLRFRIVRGTERSGQELEFEVPADDYGARVLRFCRGPICKDDSLGVSGIARATDVTLSALSEGNAVLNSTPIIPQQMGADPRVLAIEGVNAGYWRQLLAGSSGLILDRANLARELSVFGLRIPRASNGDSTRVDGILRASTDHTVIANNAQAAAIGEDVWKAHGRIEGSTRTAEHARVISDEMLTPSISSWLNLPAPTDFKRATALATSRAATVLGARPRDNDGTESRLPLAGLLSYGAASEASARYVVIGTGTDAAGEWDRNVLTMLALLRSVSWAAEYVSSGQGSDPLRADEESRRVDIPGPLLTRGDLDQRERQSNLPRYYVAILLLGCYWVYRVRGPTAARGAG